MRFYRLFSVHIHAFLFPFARPSFASHLRALPTVSSLSIVQFRRVLECRLSPGNTRFRPISPVRNLRLLGQSIFSNRDGEVSEIRKVSRRLIVELEIG